MHIPGAFCFGLILGANAQLSIWLYLLWAKWWRIEVTSISISSHAFAKYAHEFMVKGTRVIIDYMPYMGSVGYLGYLPEDYDRLGPDERRYAFLSQTRFRQLIITASPYLQAFAGIGFSIYLFDTNKDFVDNLSIVSHYLKDIILYSLWLNDGGALVHLSSLGRTPLFALFFVYYGSAIFIFYGLNKLFAMLNPEKIGLLFWLTVMVMIASLLFFWVRVPYCIASLLSLSLSQAMSDLLLIVAAIYVSAYTNAALICFFIRRVSRLTYRINWETGI